MEGKGIRIITKNNLKYINFAIFAAYEAELIAAYSTRLGGVSEGIYESLNLGFTRGDRRENVLQNYRLFAEAIGVDKQKLVLAPMCHHSNIKIVDQNDLGKGITRPGDDQDFDGLITNVPGIPLVTLHADCAAIFFFDPRQKVIGLAHAGWRGTTMEIAKKMVEKLVHHFHSDPQDLLVAIGPTICGNCYELGEDLLNEFTKMSIDVRRFIQMDYPRKKFRPDIALINKQLMIENGVKPENIALSNLCPMENLDFLFSHRGHAGKRGSNAAIMQLKS